MKQKLMSDTILFFAIEQQKVRIITAFLRSFEGGLGRVSKWHVQSTLALRTPRYKGHHDNTDSR